MSTWCAPASREPQLNRAALCSGLRCEMSDATPTHEDTFSDVQAEVVLYTLPFCPHCGRARALLARRGSQFHEIDGAHTPGFRRSLAALTGGFTVPQIVIDGDPVGGADDLARLDRVGVLAALVGREPFPLLVTRRRLTRASLSGWLLSVLRRGVRASALETRPVWLDRRGRVVSPPSAEPADRGASAAASQSILRA